MAYLKMLILVKGAGLTAGPFCYGQILATVVHSTESVVGFIGGPLDLRKTIEPLNFGA